MLSARGSYNPPMHFYGVTIRWLRTDPTGALRGLCPVPTLPAAPLTLKGTATALCGLLRGGFQISRASRPATRNMQALCNSDWVTKPRRS